MRNSKHVDSKPFKLPYTFKSVQNYVKQLSPDKLREEYLDPSIFKIIINREQPLEKVIEKESSERRLSRFSFETQTKYASVSLRDSTNHGIIMIQGENSQNFLKPDNQDEVCHILSDDRSSLVPPDFPGSKDILATSTSHHRQSVSQISLPPIQEKDPFAIKSVADQWKERSYRDTQIRYSQSAIKERPKESDSMFAMRTERSHESNFKESQPRLGMNKLLMRKIRSNSTVEELSLFSINKGHSERKSRHLPPLHEKGHIGSKNGDLSPKTSVIVADDDDDLSYINPENDILEILKQSKGSEVVDLEDLPLAKRTHALQEIDGQVNYILNSGKIKEALHALDTNAPTNESNGMQRFREIRSLSQSALKTRSLKTFEKKMSDVQREQEFRTQKASGSLEKLKKKKHYDKWFVPVEYWNVIKEASFKEKKCEELKKNLLFVYNNIHNYNKKDFNPLSGKPFKGVQQVRYEAVQEKLKHDPIIPRIKKSLLENNMRVPKFLKSIKTEKIADL